MNVWPFRHNWDQPVVERFAWNTAIDMSWDGTEERRSLRAWPRKSFDQKVTMYGDAAAYADALLFASDMAVMEVPVPHNVSIMSSAVNAGATLLTLPTDNRGFRVGGKILLYRSYNMYEVATITNVGEGQLSVTALSLSWPAFTAVFPLVVARLPAEYVNQRVTAAVAESNFSWILMEEEPFDIAEAPVVYRGVEVLTRRPNRATVVPLHYLRSVESIDNVVGIPTLDQRYSTPRLGQQFEFITFSREDRWALYEFIHRRRGRKTPFWHPSFQTDLVLLEDVEPDDDKIVVKDIGLQSLYGSVNRQDIVVFNGTDVICRRIVGRVGNELELNAPLGVSFKAAARPMICWLILSRLSADTVEFSHQTAEVSRLTLSTLSLSKDESVDDESEESEE